MRRQRVTLSIPNVVHFIWFTGPKSRDFSFVNYLAVLAAHEVQHPDAIYVHHNDEPQGNPHWEAIKPYATLVRTEAPQEHRGITLGFPQYQADVARLQILLRDGGIYLDTDTLLIKPLTPFMGETCVMSPDKVGEPTAMNAGLIMAEPGAPFIRKWLDAMKVGKVWAEHAVSLPWRLYQEDPALVHLRAAAEFIPFAFEDADIFGEDAAWITVAHAVHMWETYWHKHRQPLDEIYFAFHDNAFTRLFSKYLP